jgi:hypothetical protein
MKTTTRYISISTLRAPVAVRFSTVGQSFSTCAYALVAGRRIVGDVVGFGSEGAAVASLVRQIERAMPDATVAEL